MDFVLNAEVKMFGWKSYFVKHTFLKVQTCLSMETKIRP